MASASSSVYPVLKVYPRAAQLRARIFLFLLMFLSVSLLSPVSVYADKLKVDVSGLKSDKLIDNVKAHVGSKWVSSSNVSSRRRREVFQAEVEVRAADALRPYGYYFPEIESILTSVGEESWLLDLKIRPGEAVKINQLTLNVKGDGSGFEKIVAWQEGWPLVPGKRLNQVIWDQQKEAVLNIAEQQGYLSAAFDVSLIALNLDDNTADLNLVFNTGPRAVMGSIEYSQDIVNDSVLVSIPRFDQGDYYRTWLVDKFRTDLWRAGYFDDIEVIEIRQLDQQPQRVDFKVTLSPRKKNTHQGTIGYGTDSQFRTQYRWQRHLLSPRGDSLGLGLGWQQKNEELLLFGDYRIPRKTRSSQYWQALPTFSSEVQDVELDSENEGSGKNILSGRVEDFSVRLGNVKLRQIGESQEQLIETIYVQFLLENNDLDPSGIDPSARSVIGRDSVAEDELLDSNYSIALGLAWDWPVILGKRFETTGHHERAWAFTANDVWGSEREFTQIYLSSRWNFLLSERWKLLLRGEVGYSNAQVHEFEQENGDDVLSLSVTELPFMYRFKAGGSSSVRGYGFESLSNNNIGSNNIITASAEIEYQFKQDWSLAVFYDTGNAFNDWDDKKLRAGIGVGLRWYTLAGAIRIDVAQAQDIDGKPWQLHLTIGTPLL